MDALVDTSSGLVSRAIFSDPAIYERELSQIFGQCWQMLGHESMIPNSGDFLTISLGNDPIIVCRDSSGAIHAFLNSCRHRGNKVCLFDSGNADVFTCSYHGWRYGTDGALRGVPYAQGAYFGELKVEDWGLIPVPHIEVHSGLIFGSWDTQGVSLVDYLGPAAWYLDNLVLAGWGDGIEVVAGPFSYLLDSNWKIIAENNTGDHYHSMYTHRSMFKLGHLEPVGQGQSQPVNGPFEVALPGGHGIGGVQVGVDACERDVLKAKELGLGPKVVKYIRDRWQRKMEYLPDVPVAPYLCTHGNIFPNFSFSGHGGALSGRGMYLLQPTGPVTTRSRQWALVERDAPEIVKELAVVEVGSHGQVATGIFAQDDAENFERVTESTLHYGARRFPFNLTMGLDHEGRWPGQEEWQVKGLPGLVGPRFSEHSQRGMYAHWARLMDLDAA